MDKSTEMRQTALERRIEELGPAGARRLAALLVSLVVAGLAAAVPSGVISADDPVFGAQTAVTLLFFAMLPVFVHNPLSLAHLPTAIVIAVISCTALLPSAFVFLRFVFLGHSKIKDPQWYDAVWRIYAVMGLWILFAVINEAKIRPLLRAREARSRAMSGAAAPNTIVSRADAMRRAKRDEKLAGLTAQIRDAQKRRKDAKKALDSFDETAKTAKKNVGAAEKLVADASKRLKSSKGEARKAVAVELETAKALADGARAHEEGLKAQASAHKLVLEDAAERLKDLSEKWEHWSNLENYPFYR